MTASLLFNFTSEEAAVNARAAVVNAPGTSQVHPIGLPCAGIWTLYVVATNEGDAVTAVREAYRAARDARS